MALLAGRKRWTLFPRDQLALLYPVWREGTHDPSFEVDLKLPDYRKHPAAAALTGWQCAMEAGDLLFVPSGCPHEVENEGPGPVVAVSCNYVDSSNLERALEALALQGLTDERAAELLAALEAVATAEHPLSPSDPPPVTALTEPAANASGGAAVHGCDAQLRARPWAQFKGFGAMQSAVEEKVPSSLGCDVMVEGHAADAALERAAKRIRC
ncbi:hypothetical protein JKP88DRAFT_218036 [Tribonema minus]|uniref:JmjC domain-containing protein n=1 Tax=Tribonema minus TaxID=303371 RepID=A0A835ZEW7_9STRA|nr:hypothetical protein JKP88DRAFT_218036 [Tribonema minus]